jgi:methionyl-tRNA formyltransferase
MVAQNLRNEVSVRVLFLGGTDLGWKCCERILADGHDVVGVLSIPEHFTISWSDSPVRNVNFRSFTGLTCKNDIPMLSVSTGMKSDAIRKFCSRSQPDLIVAAGWYYLIPQRIRRLAPLGTVGIHASLLPRYRGGAPLVWAVINGERVSGVSLFHLTDGVDEGDIISQAEFAIAPDHDIRDVLRSAEAASLKVMGTGLSALASGNTKARPQNHERATYVSQRRPEDGNILWDRMTAEEVYNWVRAQTHPYPGAFSFVGGRRVRIWQAAVSREPSPGVAPGEFGLGKVGCVDGKCVALQKVQLDDGEDLTGSELLNAFHTGTFENSERIRHAS